MAKQLRDNVPGEQPEAIAQGVELSDVQLGVARGGSYFQALSNVLKAQSDVQKGIIGNLR